MLNSHITAALAQARIEDFRRERIERTAPARVRARPAGPTRRSRMQIGLRALRTNRA